MKHFFALFLLLCSISTWSQFVNGDFENNFSYACNAGVGWTIDSNPANLCEVTDIFQPGNFWIDLTPCGGFGNGTWIEQEVNTIPGTCYSVTMDIASYCGWDGSDAGIYLQVDGTQIGDRIFNDVFSCVAGTLGWGTFTSDVFTATASTTTIRFIGEGRCSSISDPSLCAPLGGIGNPGVIGLDNIVLNLESPAVVLANDLANIEICNTETATIGYDEDPNYSYLWNTGDTTAQIDVSEAGIYIVAASTSCSVSRDTIEVEVAEWPMAIDLGADQQFCDEFELEIDAGRDVVWSTDTIASSIVVNEPGIYIATESNACGIASDTLVVLQGQTPGDSFEVDMAYCEGSVISLTVPSNDAFWSTGDQGEEITIAAGGQYTAEASNGCGQGLYVFNITIDPCDYTVYAPNAFTPNGDGINDIWIPVVDGVFDSVSLSVWSRWGEKIWQSTDVNHPWVGDVRDGDFYACDGLYSYKIVVMRDSELKEFVGHLHLLR